MTDPMPDGQQLDTFATVGEYVDSGLPETARTLMDLEAASNVIRDYCGWHIYPQVADDVVVVQRPGGNKVLLLPTVKLVELTEVTELARCATAEPVELDVDELEWDESGVVEKLDGCRWTARSRGVTAVMTHGYEIVPAVIRQLCIALAARAAASPSGSVRSAVGMRSEAWAQGAFNAPAGGSLLKTEMVQLDPYVRVN